MNEQSIIPMEPHMGKIGRATDYTSYVTYYSIVPHCLSEEIIMRLADDADAVRLSCDGGPYYEWSYEDGTLYPEVGTAYLLGTVIPIRSIGVKELLSIRSQTDGTLLFKYNNRMPSTLTSYKDARSIAYTDYGKIVDELHSANILSIGSSTNVMCLDSRTFTIRSSSTLSPKLQRYAGHAYDVDILGTAMFTELSDEMKQLYRETFKRVEHDI